MLQLFPSREDQMSKSFKQSTAEKDQALEKTTRKKHKNRGYRHDVKKYLREIDISKMEEQEDSDVCSSENIFEEVDTRWLKKVASK